MVQEIQVAVVVGYGQERQQEQQGQQEQLVPGDRWQEQFHQHEPCAVLARMRALNLLKR